MEKVIFYSEWLSLEKKAFNILTMLAEYGGTFSGTYADICRYQRIQAQTKNRTRIQNALDSLIQAGFITFNHSGQTLSLTIVPKEIQVHIPRCYIQAVLSHSYSSASVAPEQVLKVYIWLSLNSEELVTGNQIASAIGCSNSTVSCALKVLKQDYEAIVSETVTKQYEDNTFRTLGQNITLNAWWNGI